MKSFLWTFVAVLAGIFIYARIKGGGKATKVLPNVLTFEGPDFDPLTGMNIVAGNGAGTVGATSGPVDNFGPVPGVNVLKY